MLNAYGPITSNDLFTGRLGIRLPRLGLMYHISVIFFLPLRDSRKRSLAFTDSVTSNVAQGHRSRNVPISNINNRRVGTRPRVNGPSFNCKLLIGRSGRQTEPIVSGSWRDLHLYSSQLFSIFFIISVVVCSPVECTAAPLYKQLICKYSIL